MFAMEMSTGSCRVVVFGLLDAYEDVTGDDSDALLLRELEALGGDAVQDAQIVCLPNAGHFPDLEEPERFSELLLAHLARVPC